jgi:hypothetical protein
MANMSGRYDMWTLSRPGGGYGQRRRRMAEGVVELTAKRPVEFFPKRRIPETFQFLRCLMKES